MVSKSYGYICNFKIRITDTIQGLFIKTKFHKIYLYNSNIKYYVVPKLGHFETVTSVSVVCGYHNKETIKKTLKKTCAQRATYIVKIIWAEHLPHVPPCAPMCPQLMLLNFEFYFFKKSSKKLHELYVSF